MQIYLLDIITDWRINMAKKEVSMEAGLWKACNDLRGNVSATDYVNVVLGLLFLRFAFDKFNDQRNKLLADPETAPFADNPRSYGKDNVFFLRDETEIIVNSDTGEKRTVHTRWDWIKDHSKDSNILVQIDDAFRQIEKDNTSLKGALDIGFYPTLHIEPSRFSTLIDTIAKMNYSKEETDDVIGRVYEYFLRKFCIKAKDEKGEFYTPGNIVDLMTQLIEPYSGSVYDPCCGSGGMFVQSAKFIEKHHGNKKDITIFGQEWNPKTYRLARMNLAIRGLSCNLGDEDASSFTKDKHSELKADYILANPPFNQKNWWDEQLKQGNPFWRGYDIPPASNGNYAWILLMLKHLSYGGTGAFLLANGALSAGEDAEEVEYKIRRDLIKNDKVEAIIVLPREMFYATDISVTLWIVSHDKGARKILRDGQETQLRDRKGEILFIDARTLGDGGNNDDGYVLLTEEDKKKIINTFFKWRTQKWEESDNVDEFCYCAKKEEIESKKWSLVPSKYIKFVDHDLEIDYESEMNRIQNEIRTLLKEERDSQKELVSAFKGIGHDVE